MISGRWAWWISWPVATVFLCLLGPIRLYDATGIPLTLQSFGVVLVPLLFGSRIGLAAVCTYLALGGMGLPGFCAGHVRLGAVFRGNRRILDGFSFGGRVCGPRG